MLTLPALIAVITYLVLTFLVKPVFTSTALFIPPQQQQSSASALLNALPGIASLGGGAVAGLKNPADQWIGLLKSDSVASGVVARTELTGYYAVANATLAKEILAKNTRITNTKEGLIKLDVEDHDPAKAQKIAAQYLLELKDVTARISRAEANQRREYFEGLMKDAKNQLIIAERSLKSSGINQSLLRASPERSASYFAQMNSMILAQRLRIATLQTQQTEESSALKQAVTELRMLEQQLKNAERESPISSDAGGADYIERYRNFKYQEALFEIMAKQYEMARADELRQGVSLQVVDEPKIAELKSKPQKAFTTVFAYALALVLCFVGVLILDSIKVNKVSTIGHAS